MAWKQLHETKSRQIQSFSFGYKHENIWARIGEVKIWEISKQKLLGVVIDREISFNEYVSSLCKKAGRKLSVLSRLSDLMSFQQRKFQWNRLLKPSLDIVH